MSYLIHYGILGQKWGIRRYQNPDGTLTNAGKERRKISQKAFDKAKYLVRRDAHDPRSSIDSFKREPLDINKVKQRGSLSSNEAIKCARLGEDIFEKASSKEPKITNDLLDAVSNTNSKMYGLQFRLKQPTSLSAKIGSDAKADNISFEESARKIKDSVRYTILSEDNRYVHDYSLIKNNLSKKGYEETKCKNYFEKYKLGEVQHKSVQSTFKNKDGFEFEIQFQTPSSQAAKELKVPIYEERRKAGNTSQRNLDLESQMHDLAERVPYPKGISKIKSH